MNNLTVLAFANPTQAFALREALVNLQGQSLMDLADAVVVTRDAAGKVELHQAGCAAAGCAAAGSVAGLILGAIFAAPWAISAVGAGAGAVIAALTDFGIDDRFLKQLGATLAPGTAALGLLGSRARLDELEPRLGPLLRGCTLLQTTVDTAREAEIRKWLENHQA